MPTKHKTVNIAGATLHLQVNRLTPLVQRVRGELEIVAMKGDLPVAAARTAGGKMSEIEVAPGLKEAPALRKAMEAFAA